MTNRQQYEVNICEQINHLNKKPNGLNKLLAHIFFQGKLLLGHKKYGLTKDFISICDNYKTQIDKVRV